MNPISFVENVVRLDNVAVWKEASVDCEPDPTVFDKCI